MTDNLPLRSSRASFTSAGLSMQCVRRSSAECRRGTQKSLLRYPDVENKNGEYDDGAGTSLKDAELLRFVGGKTQHRVQRLRRPKPIDLHSERRTWLDFKSKRADGPKRRYNGLVPNIVPRYIYIY